MEDSQVRIATDIEKFAREHGLRIHPGQEPRKWAALVIRKGGCPCVPGRKSCPCEYAMDDINELGRCRCGLFCNDDYINNYNSLHAKRRDQELVNPALGKARGEFLKKISVNGFSIEEKGNQLILRPRGAEGTAEVIIEESEPGAWKVASASGGYTGFARGKKRSYFEKYLTQWATEATLQAGERPALPL